MHLKGETLNLEGSITVRGRDAVVNEKLYLGSTSGGIVNINFTEYNITHEKAIDISGGKGEYPMGPSGGGKVIFS